MECKKCGHNMALTDQFCSSCGHKVLADGGNVISHASTNYVANTEIREIHKNKLFGFRSGKWYKMTIASMYLLFVLMMIISVIVGSDDLAISLQDKAVSMLSEIIFLLAIILPYLIMSNIFGLRTKLPLYRSKGKFLKIVAVFLTALPMWVGLGMTTRLYTQEYVQALQMRNEQQEIQVEETLQEKTEEQSIEEEQQTIEEQQQTIEEQPSEENQIETDEVVITDASEIMVSSVKTVDGEREVELVPITRTVNGVRIRTITTETEGIGIVKIIATKDVVEGLNELSEFGFSNEDILRSEEILSSVGITEVYLKDYITTNATMGIAQAYIYDSEGIQLNLTFENNELFYVQITGIAEDFDVSSSREDKLDLGVGLQGSNQVDMYYDYEGGELAYLDWGLKTLNKVE